VPWFALQVVGKDGRLDPPAAAGFVPGAKIFANADRKPVVVRRAVGP
jgi:hypothetical protein